MLWKCAYHFTWFQPEYIIFLKMGCAWYQDVNLWCVADQKLEGQLANPWLVLGFCGIIEDDEEYHDEKGVQYAMHMFPIRLRDRQFVALMEPEIRFVKRNQLETLLLANRNVTFATQQQFAPLEHKIVTMVVEWQWWGSQILHATEDTVLLLLH